MYKLDLRRTKIYEYWIIAGVLVAVGAVALSSIFSTSGLPWSSAYLKNSLVFGGTAYLLVGYILVRNMRLKEPQPELTLVDSETTEEEMAAETASELTED